MNKKISKLLVSFSLLSLLLIPSLSVFADSHNQNPPSQTGNQNPPSQTNNQNPPSQTNNSDPKSIRLVNPLGTTKTLPELVEGLLRIVLTIGIPIVALAIIYAGFQFVAAQGNPTKLQEARRTLLYVLIGAAILLAAYVIAEAMVGTINAIRGE